MKQGYEFFVTGKVQSLLLSMQYEHLLRGKYVLHSSCPSALQVVQTVWLRRYRVLAVIHAIRGLLVVRRGSVGGEITGTFD